MDQYKEELKNGLMAMRAGDKTKAWDLLFPLAQKGHVQSMFYLGEMMVSSPEYGDNLERALKFFTVAASKGHVGAESMISRVEKMIAQKSQKLTPTIANLSGVPTRQDLMNVNAKLEEYKSGILRFVDNTPEAISIDRIEVKAFTANHQTSIENASKILESLKNKYGLKIKASMFVVINPAEWQPDSSPIGGTRIPSGGITPDLNGFLAKQLGVTTLPTVVVTKQNGSKYLIDDLTTLNNTIDRLL